MTATLDEYRAIIADRPKKLAPEDVNFREAKRNEPPCLACIHWYRGAAMERDVCEIMRPEDEQVPWNWTCDFQTQDGEHFPLYREPKKAAVAEGDENES